MDPRATPARAILIERNKLVGRRLTRYLTCAGFDPIALEDPAELPKHAEGAALVAADVFDAEQVAQTLAQRPTMRAVLWTAEPLARSLRYIVAQRGMSNVLGRADFDSAPRGWELMMVLRRL